MIMKKYDVFISSKSEDYHYAEEVYDFLTASGLSVFIASEELKKIGESQYADAIDEALDDSDHIVVVASSLDNIRSKWVKYEWSTFSNDLKSGYRDGNLLTILIGNIKLKDLPPSLRHHQSFNYESYKNDILGYLKVRQNDDENIEQDKKENEYLNRFSNFAKFTFVFIAIIIFGVILYFLWKNLKHIQDDSEQNISVGIMDTVNGVTFKMIRIDGGSFFMGAQKENPNGINYDNEAMNIESPVHEVVLSDYYIGETEVTQELWLAIMRNNSSCFKGDKNPVENVTWEEAVEFCRRLTIETGKTYRLPTEAEWEYAARGGNKTYNYKYSGSVLLDYVGWYKGNSENRTHEVRSIDCGKNELGLYDMSGNVWEWCQDYYCDYSSDSQDNPMVTNSTNYRVLRGGSWYSNTISCRVSYRGRNYPNQTNNRTGFRLVLVN